MSKSRRILGATAALAVISGCVTIPAVAATSSNQHVLLISIDGMHQLDLTTYVKAHPGSTLAKLVNGGVEYTNVSTPFPSDSFPGMVGMVTGGNPKTTGIYYDVTFNNGLIDPAASKTAVPAKSVCTSTAVGANVAFDESLDKDSSRIDAGQGLPSIPSDILQMTGKPQTLINPTALPINPKTCTRVYPHQYLQSNTVFELAKAAGLRTAWSDKHPAYEILNGPSGTGVDDLFTPEINSNADANGDWTSQNSLTQQYDAYKVQAVLNEIKGYDHSGKTKTGVPAIYGMNFQSVSTAQKLPISGGQPGGYSANGQVPGPVVNSALAFVDASLGKFEAALKASGQDKNTTVIVTAKHGQSPMDYSALKRIDDGAIVDGMNAAWKSAHPTAAQPLVAASMDDDGMLLWFTQADRNSTGFAFAQNFLKNYSGSGTGANGTAKSTDYNKNPVAYTAAGLDKIYAGPAAAAFMGQKVATNRTPDVIGVVQHGVVYTGGTKKIAEHGGDAVQDRHVLLVVDGPNVNHGVNGSAVETTQIAPTIAQILGLNPQALTAVKAEHTHALTLK